METMGRIGLSILGMAVLGSLVLGCVGNVCGLISEAGHNRQRKKLDKLANDPNSRVIKIGNEYYEFGDVTIQETDTVNAVEG